MRLKIAAADIKEFGRPRLHAIGRFGEFTRHPPTTTSAHGTLIDRAVAAQKFRWHEAHLPPAGPLTEMRGTCAAFWPRSNTISPFVSVCVATGLWISNSRMGGAAPEIPRNSLPASLTIF